MGPLLNHPPFGPVRGSNDSCLSQEPLSHRCGMTLRSSLALFACITSSVQIAPEPCPQSSIHTSHTSLTKELTSGPLGLLRTTGSNLPLSWPVVTSLRHQLVVACIRRPSDRVDLVRVGEEKSQAAHSTHRTHLRWDSDLGIAA